MRRAEKHMDRGPFRADQLKSGDAYELSNGHAILCLPSGGRHSRSNALTAQVVASDPLVESVGVDVGYSPEPGTLRAPDVSVGRIPNEPGWVQGAPPLAIECADRGQDERELQSKINDLLKAGTRYVWAVRLVGPRRVEVYEPQRAMRVVGAGQELTAPGILKNPVPVDALFRQDAALQVTLRNLLQRCGYESLDAVRQDGVHEGHEKGHQEGRVEGREEGHQAGQEEGCEQMKASLFGIVEARGIKLSKAQRAQVTRCRDLAILRTWLVRAAVATKASDVIRLG